MSPLFHFLRAILTPEGLLDDLSVMQGYNKPVPALLAGSIVALFAPVYFLFPLPDRVRDRLPRHVKSVMAELVVLGGTAAYMIITVSDLHAE